MVFWSRRIWGIVARELAQLVGADDVMVPASELLGPNATRDVMPWNYPPEVVARFFALVFAQCITDRASSIHFWLSRARLTYLVGGVEYEMVAPPAAMVGSVARALSIRAGIGARRRRGVISIPIRRTILKLSVEYCEQSDYLAVAGFDRRPDPASTVDS